MTDPDQIMFKRGETRILSGTVISKQIRNELTQTVAALVEANSETARPGLAVILVGDRADSASYVRSKKKACAEIGINDVSTDFPEDVTQDALIQKLAELNVDSAIHGILVQVRESHSAIEARAPCPMILCEPDPLLIPDPPSPRVRSCLCRRTSMSRP